MLFTVPLMVTDVGSWNGRVREQTSFNSNHQTNKLTITRLVCPSETLTTKLSNYSSDLGTTLN